MRVFPREDSAGNVTTFEIANWKLSRRRAGKIVERLPGVIMMVRPNWPFRLGKAMFFVGSS